MQKKSGCFRRFINLQNKSGEVTGHLEDDFHNFVIYLRHDCKRVISISAEVIRYPWSTCPGAVQPLQALVAKPLVSRASDIGKLIDMRTQCTHLFDLAGLMMAHAYKGGQDRFYEVVVPDREVVWNDSGTKPIEMGQTNAKLLLNKVKVLWWEINDNEIVGPAEHPRVSLDKGFRRWTESLSEERAEYSTILRRAVMVSSGRMLNMSQFNTAQELGRPPVCHTFQLDTAPKALRMVESYKDFSGGAE